MYLFFKNNHVFIVDHIDKSYSCDGHMISEEEYIRCMMPKLYIQKRKYPRYEAYTFKKRKRIY